MIRLSLVQASKLTCVNGITTNLAENDPYVPCEGEISMKCSKSSFNNWKKHKNSLRVVLDNIKCYADESPSCDYPIVRHLNAFTQAFLKHLNKHKGELGKMVGKIPVEK